MTLPPKFRKTARRAGGWLVSYPTALALICAPLTLTGCASMNSVMPSTLSNPTTASACGMSGGVNKTEAGAVLGLITGAAIGYFTDSQNRTQGVLFGGGAGALFGGAVGAKLDADDCNALTADLDRSLQNGEESDFQASSADIHARIVPSATTYETRQITIARASGVAAPDDLQVLGHIGYAREDADILSSPGGSGATVLGTLPADQPIRIVGYPAPEAQSHYDLVAQGGIAVGYIKASQLSRVRPEGVDTSSATTLAVIAPIRAKPDLDADSGDPNDTTVTATIPCRSVAVTTSGADSGSSTPQMSSTNACQTPDGAWNQQDNLSNYGA